MRFWRRSTPGPVPGPDPGAETADALAEDTEHEQPREDSAFEALQPAQAPESVSAPVETLSHAVEQADRRQWSTGFWRSGAPTPEPERPESLQPSDPPPVETPQAPLAPENAETAERRGWFNRLKVGMARSSARLTDGINTIFNRRRLDDDALLELEELLIASDMGVGIAAEVTEALRKSRFNQEVSPEEVREALAEHVIRLVEPVMKPLRLDLDRKPFVILVVGVNGGGKTTTIAKLAKQYRDAGHDVVLAAGDTFRAAGVEQLQIWGERTGLPGGDEPGGVGCRGARL